MGADIISSLVNMVGGPVIDALAKKTGLPVEMVNKLKPIVVGLVVAGIARVLKQPNGADKLQDMIGLSDKAMRGENAADYVASVDPHSNTDLMTSLAGDNSLDNVLNNFAGNTGVSADQLKAILGSVAPVVLSNVGQVQKNNNLTAEQLATSINDGIASMPEMAVIDNVLDNKPGFMDDIQRGLGALGGLFGKKS